MLVNEILGKRYQIQQQLSKKNGRQTFLARDWHTQDLVIIKLVALSSDFEWDDLKLFEREAETLKILNHPSLPQYLDYFEVKLPNLKGFALVQSYISAKSLEEYFQTGRTFTEEEVKELTVCILEIIDYLHEQNPPIIHRDIKPSNILLGDRSGHSVGKVYLVDFGSVQTVATQEEGGTMTVVGTYGYMPPEQFGGRTVPGSDLYSLGATLIYLVTGTHPADLPQKDFRIQFEQNANLSPSFANWLRQMTQPSLEKRFDSTTVALQALNEPQQHLAHTTFKKPFGSKIKLAKNRDYMEIVVPPSGFIDLIKAATGMLIFTPIVWGVTCLLTLHLFSINFWFIVLVWIPFFLISLLLLLFWIQFPYLLIDSLLGQRRLRLESERIYFTHEFLNQFLKFHFKGSPLARRSITKLIYKPGEFINEKREQSPSTLEIRGEKQNIQIGGSIKSNVEIEWLAHELSEWLDIPITQALD
jgi:serine/threonine protein kinase